MLNRIASPTLLKRSKYYQPARMLAFKLAGKNPMASVQEAVEGHTTAQRFSDVLAGFLSSCHLLKRDARDGCEIIPSLLPLYPALALTLSFFFRPPL